MADVDKLLGRINVSAAKQRSAMTDLQGAWHDFGVVSAGVAVAVGGFFAGAEHAAIGYQDALTTVQVNAHLTAVATDVMGVAIEHAAVGTTSSATQMAAALGPVSGELMRIQGGALDAAGAQKVLAASQDLVESSDAALAPSVKAVADLLLVYHKNASDAAGISDSLFQAHSLLGIGVDRLAMMLQRLQPRIAGSGVDMQHLLGIVVSLTPAVGSGTRAMLMVGTILQQIEVPSKAAQKALGALGVSLTDAQGKFIGLEPAVEKIRGAMLRLHDPVARNALLQALFGRNANIAATLIAGGAAGIEASVAALNAQGTAAQAAAVKQADAAHQMEMLPKTFEDIQTAIGMVLLPSLNRLLLAVTPILTAVADWVTSNPQLATTVLALAGGLGALGAILVFIGPVVGALTGFFIGFLAPVATIGVALGVVVAAMSQVPGIMEPLQRLFSTLGGAVAEVALFFGEFAKSVGGLITGKKTIGDVIASFGDLLGAILRAGGWVIGALADVATSIARWALSMIPTVLNFFLSLGGKILDWALQVAPQIVDALAGLARSVTDAVVGAIPGVVDGLAQVGSTILGWLEVQAAAWAPLLATWVAALTGWISDVVPRIASALADLANQVTDWIVAAAPVIANAVGSWIGSVADWILTNGIPLVNSAIDSLVQGVVNLIGDGETLYKITAALASWTIQFVSWAAVTAVEAVAGLIAWIGSTLVRDGPRLAGAALTAGAAILAGIISGVIQNPAQIAEAIGALLVLNVVIAAVSTAAEAAGAAYALALRGAKWLAGAIVDAWQSLTAFVVNAILGAGGAHGLIYQGAVKAAAALLGVFNVIWTALGFDPIVLGAAGASGAEAGTAYEAGVEGAASGGQLALGLGSALTAAGASAAPAAEAAGAGLGSGIVASVLAAVGTIAIPFTLVAIPIAATYVAIKGGLDQQAAAIGDSVGKTIASGSIAGMKQAQAALLTGIQQLATPSLNNLAPGIFAADQIGSLKDQYDKVTTAIKQATDAQQTMQFMLDRPQQIPGLSQLGTLVADLPNIASAAKSGAQAIVQNIADRISEGKTWIAAASIVAMSPLQQEMQTAAKTAAAIAGDTPGQIADALASGQAAVDSGAQALADALKHPITLAAREAAIQGQLAGSQLAAGLNSKDPLVVAAAEKYRQSLLTQLAQLKATAGTSGASIGDVFGNNLANALRNITPTVKAALMKMGKLIAAMSPPGPESPLHLVDVWGQRTADAYGTGLIAGLQAIPSTMTASLGKIALTVAGTTATAPRVAPNAAAAASARTAGPAPVVHVTVTPQIYLDGQKVSGIISRTLFDEERTYAGSARAGSPF